MEGEEEEEDKLVQMAAPLPLLTRVALEQKGEAPCLALLPQPIG